MIERAGEAAKFGFKARPHMLRHACGVNAPLVKCAVLFGIRSAQSIKASGHTRRINTPDT
jgi:hypothetical protein